MMPGHAEDKLLPSTVQYQGVRSEAARNRGSPVNVGSAPVPVDGEQLKVKDGRVERGRQSVAIVAGKTVLLVLLYYVTSIGLTFYQKWLLKEFHFPLSVVITHLVVKYLLAASCRAVWEGWTQTKRPVLNWQLYVARLAPTGVAAAVDIGLSNWSFEYITISLYTMTKSTAIIFIMGFALLFKLEKKHWSLLAVVVMISGGLIMFTYKATQFNLIGFLMVLSASFLSGLRWTLSQMVMQRSDIGLSNAIDMMYHIQPWMIATLLPFAVAFEGITIATTVRVFRFQDFEVLLSTTGTVLVGAILAFFMEMTEFLLVSFTSSLTLSVSGIVKEVLTLTLAILVNHDEMSAINAVGLVVFLAGLTLHVTIKVIRVRKDSGNSKRSGEEELLMNSLNSDSEETDTLVSVNQ